MFLVQMVGECVRLHGLAAFLGRADEYAIRDIHLDQMVEPVWDAGWVLLPHIDGVVMVEVGCWQRTPISILRRTPVRPFHSGRLARYREALNGIQHCAVMRAFLRPPLQDY
jgi:hypothetical protein